MVFSSLSSHSLYIHFLSFVYKILLTEKTFYRSVTHTHGKKRKIGEGRKEILLRTRTVPIPLRLIHSEEIPYKSESIYLCNSLRELRYKVRWGASCHVIIYSTTVRLSRPLRPCSAFVVMNVMMIIMCKLKSWGYAMTETMKSLLLKAYMLQTSPPPPPTSNFHHSFLLSFAFTPRWHHHLRFKAITNCNYFLKRLLSKPQ